MSEERGTKIPKESRLLEKQGAKRSKGTRVLEIQGADLQSRVFQKQGENRMKGTRKGVIRSNGVSVIERREINRSKMTRSFKKRSKPPERD